MIRPTERDGRGQMILVGALLLAVTLVALALVTNSVIYTENLASRDEVKTEDAVSFRQAAVDGSHRGMVQSNFGQDDVGYATREATFETAVEDWARRSTSFLSTSGVSGEVVPGSATHGTRVSQDGTGNFDPASDDALMSLDPAGLNTHETWLVAKDSNIRNFEMTVDRSSLYERPDSLTDPLFNTLFGASPFFLATEEDDGDSYYTFVYRNPNTSPESIELVSYRWPDGGSASKIGECSVQASEATIDITGERVVAGSDVTPCPALDYYDEVSEEPDTYFGNGDDIEGTYSFIADRPQSQFRQAIEDRNNDLISAIVGGTVGQVLNDDDGIDFIDLSLGGLSLTDPLPTLSETDTYQPQSDDGTADDPYTNTAIWSADVRMDYETKALGYQTTMRVAPGLPGEASAAVSAGGGSNPSNSSPTAEFTPTPSSVSTGTSVSFDASASTDPDGSIASYEWDFDGDGTVDATGVTASTSFSSTGNKDVELTVTDDGGATDTRTKTVQVTSSGNVAPDIESLSGSPNSALSSNSGQSTAAYDVTFDVKDDSGDLNEVRVTLYRANNDNQESSVTVDSFSDTTDPGEATVTLSWSSGNACSKDVYVTVVAEDDGGKTATQQTSDLSPSC
jgi:chitodextrinase